MFGRILTGLVGLGMTACGAYGVVQIAAAVAKGAAVDFNLFMATLVMCAVGALGIGSAIGRRKKT